MKPTLIFIALLLSVSYARAGVMYFDASLAAGTDKMSDVKKVEFLFDSDDSSLRLCGAWIFADGQRMKFEQTWELAGSSVLKNGKGIGSYHDGNFLIEENVGGSKHQAIEVTRENETFFEYHYHHPDLGFVDGDGWIVEKPSDELVRSCVP